MLRRLQHAGLGKKSVKAALCLGAAASLFPLVSRAQSVVAANPYRRATDLFTWLAYCAFAIAFLVCARKLWKDLAARFLSAAFALFFVLQATSHYFALRDHAFHGSPLSALLKVFSGTIAFVAATRLPGLYRRLRTVLHRSGRSVSDEKRFAAAMESTQDAILIHEAVRDASGTVTDFRFAYINANAERMLGRSRDEMVGKLLGELYPIVLTNGRFDCYWHVVETGQPGLLEMETNVLHGLPGGPRAFVRTMAVKLDDGVCVTCTDITEQHRATQDLKRSLAFNKAIVSTTSFAILVMDPAGTITSVNPAAVTMLGYTAEELIGKNVTALHDPMELVARWKLLADDFGIETLPDSRALFARALHGLEEQSEWTYICRNGSRLPVQVRINTVEDEDGEKIAFMASSYDLTDRKQTDQYIYHLAHHDPLTGLPGRTLLRERIESAIEYGERTGTHFSVLMVDLDHFKRINDSLGHTTGDMVLREISYRLRSAVRKTDMVSRFGGDEFVILLTGLSNRGEAEMVARKLIETFNSPILAGGHEIIITASVGLSLYPESLDSDELLKHADIALAHSKGLGRNGIAVFTSNLGDMMLDRLKMESALRGAIERNELFLVYQPQISLTDHRLIGVEALIRWRSPEAGLVMPSLFIPVAEETGLIVAIGAWALERACCEIAELQKKLGRTVSVAVNLSPTQVHERHFHNTVENALALSGLDPRCLELEITEGLLMSHSEEALQIIERVQSLGVTTAIDDFGTGFSNMSYITRFKVDRLKVDQSFVSRCLTDANSLAVTTAIIALAHSLNMEVVAEGVETVEQALMLQSLACDSAQGYLYSKPLTIQAVTEFARQAWHPGETQANAWMYAAPSLPATSSPALEG